MDAQTPPTAESPPAPGLGTRAAGVGTGGGTIGALIGYYLGGKDDPVLLTLWMGAVGAIPGAVMFVVGMLRGRRTR